MLKATLGKIPTVRALINANERKIAKIRNEKIPAIEDKVAALESKIEQLTAKREGIQHKLNRVVALNDTIKSFSIGRNAERREAFSDAMDRLNSAVYQCLSDKKDALAAKRESLIDKYNQPDISMADKIKLQQKMSSVNDKIHSVEDKIDKMIPFMVYPSEEHENAAVNFTAQKLDEMAEQGNLSVTELSETAVSAAQSVKTMTHEQVAGLQENYLANAEMAVEDDYNMIDGIINNGTKEDILQLRADVRAELDAAKSIAIHPFINENIKELAREDVEKLSNDLAKIDKALAAMPEEKHEISEKIEPAFSVAGAEWLPELIDSDKAFVGEDGSFKIDPDYFKELPKGQRHIENMTVEQASAVMNELSAQNIRFSAVSRGGNKISLTVAKNDVKALSEIKKSTIGIAAEKRRSNQPERRENPEYQKVNPEYYKSLLKEERSTRVESKEVARAIVKELIAQNIPYSAVVRKNDSVAVTVSKANEQAYKQIAAEVKGERAVQYVNPDFYKSLPKSERSTQHMSEEQAKAMIQELSDKGIAHSAVLKGDKAAVTVEKKHAKTAFFSRSQLHAEVQRLNGQRKNAPQRPDPSKNKPGLS